MTEKEIKEIICNPRFPLEASQYFSELKLNFQEFLNHAQIEEDHSPVMHSPFSFWAKLEYDKKNQSQPKVILNGHRISPDPKWGEVQRRFLIGHEAFHYFMTQDSSLKNRFEVLSGPDLELACDWFGAWCVWQEFK